MASQAIMGMATAQAARYTTDFTVYIICQTQTEELHVEKPTAHYKDLEFTRDRTMFGNGHYPEVSKRIGKLTGQGPIPRTILKLRSS